MTVSIQFQYTPQELPEAAKVAGKYLRRQRKIKYGRGLAGWVLFVTLAIALVFMVSNRTAPAPAPASAAASTPAPLQDIVVPLIPWVLIFGFVWFFVFRQLRKSRAMLPKDGETNTVIADNQHLTWTRELVKSEFQWLAFQGFDETPNMFVLYEDFSDKKKVLRFHAIPKRAFPNVEMLDEFRGLLQSHARSPISAFPVIAVG